MVLGACVKLILRRFALRKGLALTAAGILLVGMVTVTYFLQANHNRREMGDTARPVLLPNAPLSSNFTHPLGLHRNQPLVQEHRPNDNVVQALGHHGDGGGVKVEGGGVRVVPASSEECVFSSTQRRTGGVDVEMSDVLESLSFANPNGGVWKQGFDITYSMEDFSADPLQVFIMPHSHNDPGWIMTFEEYYRKQTRQILSLMTDALAADPRRKFVWAEISYLDLWWGEQPEHKKELFRRLVAEGQLEIVTGGWVMNDEANTHYFAMLDQLLEGHLWLQENIPGVSPRSCWANDPFGYSPTMAYLLQRAGMEGMLIQRVHYSVKKHLAHQRQLEFAWRQGWDQAGTTDMLCHMMPFYSYDVPHTCGPDPKVCCQFDFKRLPGGKVKCPWRVPPVTITDANVQERAETLADQYRKKAQLYQSNVLLVPLGDDFRYDTKKEVDAQFANYQRLIDHYSAHPEMKIQVQFGTLSDYFTALRSTVGVQEGNDLIPFGFPSLTGDFFTYSDRDDHYWSGYFTTRPFFKNMDRILESNLRYAELFYSLVIARGLPVDKSVPRLLTSARRSLGLFQHHDGITGTAKDPVVRDYAIKMMEAITSSKAIMSSSVKSLLNMDAVTFDLEEVFLSPEAIAVHVTIDVSRDPRTVLLVNSLSQPRTQLVALSVSSPDVMVMDSDNRTVPSQINPLFTVEGMTVTRDAFELVFVAVVPAVGVAPYQLYPGNTQSVRAVVQLINRDVDIDTAVFQTQSFPKKDFVLANDRIEAKFSGKTGLLKTLTQGSDEVSVAVDFVSYGTVKGKDRSGAYLFLPDGDASPLIGSWSSPRVVIVAGPLVQTVWTDLGVVVHAVQLSNSPGVEGRLLTITNIVDIRKEANKELAMRFVTSIENQDGIFYTDNNGFQMMRRRTMDKLPLQANYYPMPTSAFLQDRSNRLSLLSGQPLGVSSLKQGWLEVMLDRRLMQDDERGLGQGIKDNRVTKETFRLLLERRLDSTSTTAPLAYPSLLAHAALDELLHPIQFLLPSSPPSPPSHPLHTFSGLARSLPCDVHMVNLRSLLVAKQPSSALFLHRRGFECGFDISPLQCDLAQGKVQLDNMFSSDVGVSEVSETTLSLFEELSHLSHDSHMTSAIAPMEIQAYRVTWSRT